MAVSHSFASPHPFLGVVSDTHGYYDDALDTILFGVRHIVHAGDIGSFNVLTRLRAVAPVTAVLGNTDLPVWDEHLPRRAEVEVLGLRILVGHKGEELMRELDPEAGETDKYDLVICGHTHRAAVEQSGRTLFLNPGAAGRARFGALRTLALVMLDDNGRPWAKIVPLAEDLK